MYIDTRYTPEHRGCGYMAKRPGIWTYGFAIGLIGVGVAASSGCDNTEFIDEGIPFDEFVLDFSEAECTSVDECPRTLLTRPDQCLARNTAFFIEGLGPAWGAGIENGRIQYFAQHAQLCLNAVAGCGKDQQFPASCFDALSGQVALGDDCLSPMDCEGDAYCFADAICPGVCTTWHGTGAACETSGDCKRNLRCISHVCTATGSEDAPCTSGADCDFDLVCLTVDGAGKCVDTLDYATATKDEACGAFAADRQASPLCALPLVCVQDDTGTTTGTCKAKVGKGDACSLAFASQCPQGYTCSGTPGVCEAMPTSGACAELYGNKTCNAGYSCVSDECTKQLENDSVCTSGPDCASNTCLDGRCAPTFVCAPDE